MTSNETTVFPPAENETHVLNLTRQREASIASAVRIAAAIAGTPAMEIGDHREFANRMLDDVGITDVSERMPLIGVIMSTLAEAKTNGK